ncbi:Sphingosine 1-Phosphate Receptor 2 [Manis pentadactyla]|nr:Sphingosine 1-Phosphate Receptor 2 [Manis pentadactyla]
MGSEQISGNEPSWEVAPAPSSCPVVSGGPLRLLEEGVGCRGRRRPKPPGVSPPLRVQSSRGPAMEPEARGRSPP